ncbi:MAG TPA: trehalose-6-phosphate synthase [Actinomycetota bacterium]|jgi:trehalose 6-phosphate synthase
MPGPPSDVSVPAIESPIVVASNRGPVSFERDDGGTLVPRRGSGGLVTALSSVFFRDDITWVSAAMTEGDHEAAETGVDVTAETGIRVRFVRIAPDVYDAYYNRIANGVLWFLHHYLWDLPRSPVFGDDTARDWQAYEEANRAFAAVLAQVTGDEPVYLIQDYHLALVPAMLRELRPDAKIVHFSHTPFAGATYMRALPVGMRAAILRGMAGADVVGFQSRTWAENFLLSCRSLAGVRVDLRRWRVSDGTHTAAVRTFPVAVNAAEIRQTAADPEVRAMRAEVERERGGLALLLRVDRLEPTKNILRGFLAYELFLERNPAWRGRVRFLSLLSPSREDVPAYRDYGQECLAEADRINACLGGDGWAPIDVRVQEDYRYAVAAYGAYDALLVNPVYDGMNLVAMEGPLVNRRRGALILSRNAGAYGRLGRQALAINPFDLSETAEAIRAALEMPADERARRARGLSRTIQAHTPATWLTEQLEAVDRIRPAA